MHVTFDLNRIQERRFNHAHSMPQQAKRLQESNRLNEFLSYTEKSILLQLG